jgi:hypothetical protein
VSAALTPTKIVLAAAVDDEGSNCGDKRTTVMTTMMIRHIFVLVVVAWLSRHIYVNGYDDVSMSMPRRRQWNT